ncbi:MAG: sugar-binding protein [Chitinispirillia bacterium]|nr:sugar-binding protein [Chitinispirillia bacterium]MCL2268403.1 sugar-binding protein [Chitinispirillia bacterium]
MKRVTTVIAALAASFMLVTGCGDKKSGETLIGIAIPETHVTRWIKDGNSLKAEAEKRGYRAQVQHADANQEIQNRHIQSFLTVGAKLLVVGSINEEAAPAIAEAAQKGVAVIAYDRLIPNSADYDYYITFNNYQVGVLKGQALAAALELDAAVPEKPKYITLFAGAPTDGNAFFFYDGVMGILNPYIEKGVLKTVGPYAKTSDDRENFLKLATENWQGSVAKARMEELLKNEAAGVTLDAILAPNDNLARAVMEAVKADPKYAAKLPLVTGQDAEFENAMLVKNGQQLCTIFKNTAQLAEAAIILADQILKGETPNIPMAYLATGDLEKLGNTGKKVVKTYLLDPVLITKDNLNIPIEAGFFTAAETAELTQ